MTPRAAGSGNVVVGGWWSKASATEAIMMPGGSGALTIGSPDTLQQYGIVAMYSQAGEPKWGRVVKTDGPSGDGFFTGAISSPVDFGGGSLDGFGGRDLFVAALDRNGAYRWAVSYGSSSDDTGVGVALGPQGLVVVAGTGGTLDVGDHHLVNAGSSDLLLLVLRP